MRGTRVPGPDGGEPACRTAGARAGTRASSNRRDEDLRGSARSATMDGC